MTASFWWPKLLSLLLLGTWPIDTLRPVGVKNGEQGPGRCLPLTAGHWFQEWASPGRMRGQAGPMDEGIVAGSLASSGKAGWGSDGPLKPWVRGEKKQQVLWSICVWVLSSNPQEAFLLDRRESGFLRAFLFGGVGWKASFSAHAVLLTLWPRRTPSQPQVT